MENVKKLINLLKSNNLTFSSCESVTGGKLGSMFVSFEDSSLFYKGTITCYSNFSKKNILKISRSKIKKYGVVSQEIAIEMSKKALKLFNSDMCISFTGNAGSRPIENKKIWCSLFKFYL